MKEINPLAKLRIGSDGTFDYFLVQVNPPEYFEVGDSVTNSLDQQTYSIKDIYSISDYGDSTTCILTLERSFKDDQANYAV